MIIALLLLLAAGFGLFALLSPREVRFSEAIGLSILFGAGAISLSEFVAGFFARGATLLASVSIIAIALFGAGLSRLLHRRYRINSGGRSSRDASANGLAELAPPSIPRSLVGATLSTDWPWLALFLLEFAFLAWQTTRHTIGWDGLFIHEMKARLAFLHGGVIPLSYFVDVSRAWSHQRYPLYLPLTEAWLYDWLGLPDQSRTKLIGLLFYPAAAALLFHAAARFSGERWKGWLAVLLLPFVPFTVFGPGGAASAWADFPLAAMFLAAAIYLLVWSGDGNVATLPFFAACAGLLPWIKQEGVVLWLCLVLIGLAAALKQKRRIGPLLLASLPGFAVILGWRVFLHATNALPSNDYVPVSLGAVMQNVDRVPMIVVYLAEQLLAWNRWNFLWPGALLGLWVLTRRGHPGFAAILGAGIALPLSLYCGTYLFSAWTSVYNHLSTSLPRLLIQLSLLALLIIVLALPAYRRGAPLEGV